MKILKYMMTLIFFIVPQPLRHKIRDISPDYMVEFIRRNVSSRHIKSHVQKNKGRLFEDKLWGGFSSYAMSDLESLRDNAEAKKRDRVYAAWALARWYACHNDHQKALNNVVLMRLLCTWKHFDLSQKLLEADCLIQLQRYQDAEILLGHALTVRPGNSQVLLSLSNCFLRDDDSRRLGIINRIYRDNDFFIIETSDDRKPLSIENLKNHAATIAVDDKEYDQPLVTVIMPVFKAAETLHIAIDSLLAQSWTSLEIIVVDDCSPDDTFAVAQRYAATDPRVSAYQLENNQGAYTARNFALTVATGEFVTTHDADDWSHPQKIETQVRHLLENAESCDANVTHWVRVYPNLEFRGTSRPTDHVIQWNHSSLMLRRELLLSLGGWDTVRITGDTELIWRLEHRTGRKIARLHKNVPLSFALEDPSSLTRQGNSHVWTIHYGVRREYREMAAHWHQRAEYEALSFKSLNSNTRQRSFPAPGFIQADKQTSRKFDTLVIMDCAKTGEEHAYNLEILRDVLGRHESVGLFHWPHYMNDVRAPIHSDIRNLAMQEKLSIVVSGEMIEANGIIASNSLALRYMIDRPPRVTPEKFQVIVSQSALTTMQAYESFLPEVVENNVKSLFNSDVEWLLASMEEDGYFSKYASGRKIGRYPDTINETIE